KKYPILIFDKRDDYLGLKDIEGFNCKFFLPNVDLTMDDISYIVDFIGGVSGEEITPTQEPILEETIRLVRKETSDLEDVFNQISNFYYLHLLFQFYSYICRLRNKI
ncbi:MAG: hypothetical protein P8Y70_00595, partial [Candidatus Lokiarchaeota archaeon]